MLHAKTVTVVAVRGNQALIRNTLQVIAKWKASAQMAESITLIQLLQLHISGQTKRECAAFTLNY